MTTLRLPELITRAPSVTIVLIGLCVLSAIVALIYFRSVQKTDACARTIVKVKQQGREGEQPVDFQLVLGDQVISQAEYEQILSGLPANDVDLLQRVLSLLLSRRQVADAEQSMFDIILREGLDELKS